MSDQTDQTAIKVDRSGYWVRIGPAIFVSGVWCFDPTYRVTLCETGNPVAVRSAITRWRRKLGTDTVIDNVSRQDAKSPRRE